MQQNNNATHSRRACVVSLAGKHCSGWPACRGSATLRLLPICILIESGNKERLKSLSTIIRSNGDAGHKVRGEGGEWLPLFSAH